MHDRGVRRSKRRPENGPENDTWPDGANTPFRAQKDTNWEGA
jgi:hypothetical protein